MPDRRTDRESYLRRMVWRRRAANLLTWPRYKVLGPPHGMSRRDELQAWTYLTDRDLVVQYYARLNDHLPDLEEPKWINEKIRWLFLNHPNPLMTLCADKLAARDYLAFKGATIRAPAIHYVLDDPRQIADIDLPSRYVFKPTFSTKRVHIETGACRTPKEELIAKAAGWDDQTLWLETGELHYRGMPKRWIVEEYLPSDRQRSEYLFFCFMGEPRIVSIVLERKNGKARRVLVDLDWKRFDLWSAGLPNDAPIPPKPANFDELLAEARRLASDFLHVRVDFLVFDGQTRFSELTFASGGAAKPHMPLEANEQLGAWIDLSQADAYLERGRRIAEAVVAAREARLTGVAA